MRGQEKAKEGATEAGGVGLNPVFPAVTPAGAKRRAGVGRPIAKLECVLEVARPAPALRCFAAPAGVTELGGSVQNSMRTRAPPAP
jgi:hypothetical protein